jgi:hypothetical protein
MHMIFLLNGHSLKFQNIQTPSTAENQIAGRVTNKGL